jgi:hypothetical protein
MNEATTTLTRAGDNKWDPSARPSVIAAKPLALPLLCKPEPDPSKLAIVKKFTFGYDPSLGVNKQTDIESDSNGEKSCVWSLVWGGIGWRSRRLCASG